MSSWYMFISVLHSPSLISRPQGKVKYHNTVETGLLALAQVYEYLYFKRMLNCRFFVLELKRFPIIELCY